MVNKTAKIKNGRVDLPEDLRRTWQGAEVFLFPNRDTLIIKKAQKPLARLSDLAEKISLPKMSSKEIQKEIQNYRKNQ